MVTPWSLLTPGSAAFAAVIWALLVGFGLGAVCVLAFGWRRLTTPSRAEDTRRLQADLAEARRQAGEMFAQSERMAARYLEAKR